MDGVNVFSDRAGHKATGVVDLMEVLREDGHSQPCSRLCQENSGV